MEPLAPPDLPQDIILKILTWTSLKGIGRCRVVSKDWNLITYDSSFMQEHYQKRTTISGFFMQTKSQTNLMPQFVSTNNLATDSKLSLDFLPGPVRIEAATKQGILVCVNYYPGNRPEILEHYVCKPSTQQWCKIPNPETRSHVLGTGMVVLGSKPFRYKIVRFSTPSTTPSTIKYRCRCEIFDSKTRGWKWKQLKDVILLPEGNFFRFASAMSVCGTLYWLLTNHNNNVLAFCVDTERWRVFELPFPLCNRKYFWYRKLVDYRGRLAMLCMRSRTSDMQLWVMEDLETKAWSLRLTICIKQALLPKDEPYYFPHAFVCSDVLLLMVLYNFKNSTCVVRELLECEGGQQTFPILSDLELVGGMSDNFLT